MTTELDKNPHLSGDATGFASKDIPDYVFRACRTEPNNLLDIFLIGFYKLMMRIIIRLLTFNWERMPSTAPDAHTSQQTANHYGKIAYAYDERHHRITNRPDLWWRRQTAFAAAVHLRRIAKPSYKPILLDMCTGTGLCLEEMFKVFALERLTVKAYGLDFSDAMLKIAKERTLLRMKNLLSEGEREVEFVCGDAMYLLRKQESGSRLFTFRSDSIDVITMVCGIGGVENPIVSFEQQLRVLRPGGIMIMFDVHRPIPDLPSKWPGLPARLWSWWEQEGWEEITVRLVLTPLWAWRDPTFAFYVLPMIAYHEPQTDSCYGFETAFREFSTEDWYFRLPALFIARTIVRKVEITREECAKRQKTLNDCLERCANVRG